MDTDQPNIELTREQLEFWIGQVQKVISNNPGMVVVAGLTKVAADLTEKLKSLKEQP